MILKTFIVALAASTVLFCTNLQPIQTQDESKSSSTQSATTLPVADEQESADKQEAEVEFDAELAAELGADEYGMKSYVFVILKTGEKTIEDKDESAKVFSGHFANMSRLAKEGKLVVAGPFIEGAPKRGLFIFNVTTIEEAEELVKTDPAVAAGVLDYELTKLYCSAALMKINEIHGTIQETKIE